MVGTEDIARMTTARDVNGLVQNLKNHDANIRSKAIEALGKLGEAAAIESLIVTLKDEDSKVRRATTEALGLIGDKSAVNSLISTLRDINKQVQRSAVKALGDIGDAKAVEPLILILKDKDRMVRGQAIISLGDIGDPAGLEPLEDLTKDDDDFENTTVGDLAKESVLRIKSGPIYREFLEEKIRLLEKEKRFAEATQIKDELAALARVAVEIQQYKAKQPVEVKSNLTEKQRSEFMADYMEKKPEGVGSTEPFNNCPFCGKQFSLKKTPRYCPYCSEELS